MEPWVLLGSAAGLLTTIGYVPQILKGYRTRKMDDVSMLMPFLLSIGMGLWLCYGLVLEDLPIVFWNATGLTLNIVLMSMKYRYR